jgi:hypothetical protein
LVRQYKRKDKDPQDKDKDKVHHLSDLVPVPVSKTIWVDLHQLLSLKE